MQGFRLLLFQSCCTRNGIVSDAYLERSPVIRMHKTLGLVYTWYEIRSFDLIG